MQDNDATLRRMGFNRASRRSDSEIAKTLRQGNGGKFGKLDILERQKRGDFR